MFPPTRKRSRRMFLRTGQLYRDTIPTFWLRHQRGRLSYGRLLRYVSAHPLKDGEKQCVTCKRVQEASLHGTHTDCLVCFNRTRRSRAKERGIYLRAYHSMPHRWFTENAMASVRRRSRREFLKEGTFYRKIIRWFI